MKIISMHKVDAAMEAGKLPSPDFIKSIGQLMGELRRSGVLVDGAGLRPSATRARLRVAKGKRTLEKGPYAGANELIDRVTMIKVRDMDQATDWAARQVAALGDGEIEIGPVTEGWDLGLMAKPADAPLRCLLLQKGDAESEAERPPAPETAAAIAQVDADMAQKGVRLSSIRLQPSRKGARISVVDSKPTFRDGPFTESKELIAGYTIVDVPSMNEAREWALRFAQVFGDVELELRPLSEQG
jgi:hypothetical protein